MTPQLVLLHSPRVGPSFWHPVANLLCAQGLRTHTPRLPSLEHAYPPYWLAHAAAIANGLPETGEVVLAAHSGAGVLLPAIGRLARNRKHSARVCGYLFIDCDLPQHGKSRLDLFADAEDAARLRRASHDNLLPQFTNRQLASLIADADVRAALIDEQPPTPLAMYEEALIVPDDWPEAQCAYVGLSEHYPQSVARAERAAWLMRTLASHHFLPVSDPQRMAETLAAVVREIASIGSP